jgi:hypothetical protein
VNETYSGQFVTCACQFVSVSVPIKAPTPHMLLKEAVSQHTQRGALKAPLHALKALLHALKALLHALKALLHALEALLHALEALLHALKALLHACKALLHACKALFNALKETVLKDLSLKEAV